MEFVATAVLLAAISGSGIMGERLGSGNVAVALLANSIATGAVLIALILAFGEVSGAHINPVVTLSNAARRSFPWRETPAYIAAQIIGAFSGIALANIMFGLPVLFASHHVRTGWPSWIAEIVATAGLITVIGCCVRWRPAFNSVCGCRLCDGSLLVLSIDVFCKSSRDTCPLHDGYLLRYSAHGRSRIPGFSIRRCCRSNGISRMAPT